MLEKGITVDVLNGVDPLQLRVEIGANPLSTIKSHFRDFTL